MTRQLALALAVLVAAPAAADFRQTATTGTWFIRAAVGSDRQVAMSEAQSCLTRLADSPSLPTAMRQGTVLYGEQSGTAELSLTWPRAVALEMVDVWAPLGGWTPASASAKAQYASRALAAHLRMLLGICRRLPPTPPADPPVLEDPLP